MTLITKVFSLILGITLMLPTFCATAAPSAIDGTWQLVNPDIGSRPFELVLNDGHNSGTMACNSYFGNYQAEPGYPCSGRFSIHFDSQASTEVACAENGLESKYLKVLQFAYGYKVCQDKLTLYGLGTLQYAKAGEVIN